ncbi:hypothetical protein QUB75_00565 [Microcoleus sp. K1-B6]
MSFIPFADRHNLIVTGSAIESDEISDSIFHAFSQQTILKAKGFFV